MRQLLAAIVYCGPKSSRNAYGQESSSSPAPSSVAEILLYANRMGGGVRGGMLEEPFNSATAADAGVVNFYDAANRCKIAKQKKVYTLTHSHMHTGTHTQTDIHTQTDTGQDILNSTMGDRPGASQHQSCLVA